MTKQDPAATLALHGAGAQLEALAASLYAGARCEEVVPQVRFDLETRAGRLLLQRAGDELAAGRLLEQSFSLWDWGAAAVELVGRLVETCPARELVFADAREAVALLLASEV